jgi:hypothetical protein
VPTYVDAVQNSTWKFSVNLKYKERGEITMENSTNNNKIQHLYIIDDYQHY